MPSSNRQVATAERSRLTSVDDRDLPQTTLSQRRFKHREDATFGLIERRWLAKSSLDSVEAPQLFPYRHPQTFAQLCPERRANITALPLESEWRQAALIGVQQVEQLINGGVLGQMLGFAVLIEGDTSTVFRSGTSVHRRRS